MLKIKYASKPLPPDTLMQLLDNGSRVLLFDFRNEIVDGTLQVTTQDNAARSPE